MIWYSFDTITYVYMYVSLYPSTYIYPTQRTGLCASSISISIYKKSGDNIAKLYVCFSLTLLWPRQMPASSSFALPFLFLLPSHLLCFLLGNKRVCTYSEMGATINELIKTETEHWTQAAQRIEKTHSRGSTAVDGGGEETERRQRRQRRRRRWPRRRPRSVDFQLAMETSRGVAS